MRRSVYTIRINGGALSITDRGSGPAVIFLHAGVADSRMWNEQIKFLSESYRVIAYDRRGYGKTHSEDCEFSHASDLVKVFDILNLKRAALIGCSQGGRVAIDFCLSYQDRVTKLVLSGPAVSGQPESCKFVGHEGRLIAEVDAAEDRSDLDEVNRLEAQLWLDGANSPEGRVSGAIRELFLEMNGIALRSSDFEHELNTADAFSNLEKVRIQTLVAHGSLDLEHVKQRCTEVASRIPRAIAHEFEECAHLPSMEAPSKFNDILAKFLSM